jgi:drug/metabolite transporter (DMT)-like permease
MYMIRISGYVLMLCSVFLYSLCEAVGKYLTSSYEPAQIIFFRSSVGMLIVAWITCSKGVQAYKPQLKLNILRNFFAASGLFLTFFSLKNLSLSSYEFVAFLLIYFYSYEAVGSFPKKRLLLNFGKK